MRRLAMFVGILALGLAIGCLSAQQPAPTAASSQPGTLVVHPQFATNGCLTMLNDAQALKRQGVCSFTIVAEGVKLPDLECHAALSGYIDGPLVDTIIDCTYSPIKKLSANPNTPKVKAGTMVIAQTEMKLGADGCLAVLNNAANHETLGKCGFNVNLQLTRVPDLSVSVKIGGGNTTLDFEYAPVVPVAAANGMAAQ